MSQKKGVLQSPVPKSLAPDYQEFVPAGQEMHLEKIEKKAKAAK